jgi:hypothetical protein
MSNGVPDNLKASHLRIAVAPEQIEGQAAAEMRAHYTAGIAAVDRSLLISERWRERVILRPLPPQPQSLAELVDTARRRLREDRLRDDRDELQARRFVLQRVAEVLGP